MLKTLSRADERFWLDHELCRLGASQRAGFNVTKERDMIERRLAALRLEQ